MNYEMQMTDQEESENYKLILAGLRSYNRSHVEKDQRALTISFFDENKKLAGGLNGATYFGWLFIEHLWVREDCRKDGLGRKLIATAEEEARKRGCCHVYLDTFSFQAPGFYEKQGYVQYAKLDEFPGKHIRYFFKKDLVISTPFDLRQVHLEPPQAKYRSSYLSAMAEMQSDSERSSWVYLGDSEPQDTPARDFGSYVDTPRICGLEAKNFQL